MPIAGADSARAAAPAISRRWRWQLVGLGLAALAVRVGYVLAFKHPVFVGGDAYWYHHGANLLVDGHGFIDAYRYRNGVVAQTADHPPGTILVLAAASLLGMRSFFWHQLEMCVLGSATVVVIAVTARQVAGRRAGLAAGIIAVLYPNLWFNDALVMSETLVQLTTALAVLAAYRWWMRPSRRRAALLGVAVAACALTRAEAVLFVPLLVAPLILLRRDHAWRERLVQAALCAVVAGLVIAPWVGYNLSRFEQPVTISTGFDPTVAVSNCDKVYYGSLLGYWWRPCILDIPPPTSGDVSTQEAYYRRKAFVYIRAHEGRVPVVVVARVARTFGLFKPVQQIQLDRIETRELGFSEVGLGMYYALGIGTLAAVWVLRRRKMPVSPIVATIAVVVFATAITFGQTRYRASAEVVLVLGGAIALAALARRVLGPDPDPGPALLEDPALGPDTPAAPEPPAVAATEVVAAEVAAAEVDEPALPAVVAAEVVAAEVAAAEVDPPAPPAVAHRRFPCFDGLRAIAAVTVVVVHTAFPSGFSTNQHRWGAYTARLEIGVAVFFLISGFLLYRPFAAAHLAGRAGPPLRPYFTRRLLRIVPAYWVALVFAAYVLHVVTPQIDDWRSVIVYFGFLQIYSSHYVLHGISAAWTLCVEMSFYVFLPVYAWALARWSRRRGRHPLRVELVGLAALVVVSELYKVAVYAKPTGQQTGAGTWLPAQLDLFALGMALAVGSVWWSEHRPEPVALSHRHLPALCWAGALGAFWVVSTQAGLPRVPVYLATLGQVLGRQSLYGVFAWLLILPAVFGPQDAGAIRRLLRSRPFVAVGLVSYGIYLWHEPWMLQVLAWRNRPLFTMSFLTLTLEVGGLAMACATASYLVVERPVQRLGHGRRRAGALAARRTVPSPAAVTAPRSASRV